MANAPLGAVLRHIRHLALFPTAKDRVAFAKTKVSRQIDRLIDSLPEPEVGPQRREYSGKFNVRIPKSLHAALASEAGAQGSPLALPGD
jgi:predicted HicB family RNase H-like nuclease